MNMFTLHVLEQCKDQLYGFTLHLNGIFLSEASLTLDIASLQDLQKLVGTSAVSLLISISKHDLSSAEKVAQLYVVS